MDLEKLGWDSSFEKNFHFEPGDPRIHARGGMASPCKAHGWWGLPPPFRFVRVLVE